MGSSDGVWGVGSLGAGGVHRTQLVQQPFPLWSPRRAEELLGAGEHSLKATKQD